MDVPLLVTTLLIECWRTNLELESETVTVEITFTGEQVQSEESVVSPALSNFKI